MTTGNSGYGMIQALKNPLCTHPSTIPIIHTMGKRNSVIGLRPLIDMPWELHENTGSILILQKPSGSVGPC